MGTTNNFLGLSPDQADNLTNFGFATMAAGQQPGINTLAAIGQGGMGMNQAAAQRAQTQLIQSEAQKNQFTNQMLPYQLKMAKLNADMAQKDYDQEYGNSETPGGVSGAPFSPAAGITPTMPSNYSSPANNPGNLRPVGQSTGFQQFPTPEDGSNGMTADLVSKVSGKSPAMTAKFGQNYQPTLANIISTWAPAGDNNNPLEYTKFVSDKTGIPPRKILTVADIPKIQEAMTQFEGNSSPINVSQNTQSSQLQTGPNAGEQAQIDKLSRQARLQKRIGGDPAPYQAQISRINDTIAARDKANIELDIAGPKQSWLGQVFEPKTAAANQTIQQASKQGVLSELGPQLTGLKGNKFLESIASGASGLNAADPPKTKVQAVNGLQDQYVANLKSLAAQRREYGDVSAPTDAQIDGEIAHHLNLHTPLDIQKAYAARIIGRDLAKSMLKNIHEYK